MSLKGPRKALAWYTKTRFIGTFSIIMFLVLFLLFFIFLSIFKLWYINVGFSILLSLILTILYFQYYNKKFIKEWKETKNIKSANKIAFIFLIGIILFAIITLLIDLNALVENIIGLILAILFLTYIYIRFLK